MYVPQGIDFPEKLVHYIQQIDFDWRVNDGTERFVYRRKLFELNRMGKGIKEEHHNIARKWIRSEEGKKIIEVEKAYIRPLLISKIALEDILNPLSSFVKEIK